MSTGLPSRQRSLSSNTRPSISSTASSSHRNEDFDEDFEPCAATGSSFLYAQGSSILCLHHDTLAIEKRFEKHKSHVTLISVDTVSEWGAGRLVVSYDTTQVAIVWDLFTGDEIARFESYQRIKVAAWMKNGNVAFGESDGQYSPSGCSQAAGNVQGNVILFEPSTSEHVSARTIFDPITALAPAADCQTFSIGLVPHYLTSRDSTFSGMLSN